MLRTSPARLLGALALVVQLHACSGGESNQPISGNAGDTAGDKGASGNAGATGTAGSAGVASAAGTAGSTDATGMAGAAASASDGSADAVADAPRGLTGDVKIMVLGSSNELITCWRALLWQKLRAADITNFDFVGGVTDGPDCGVTGYDKDVQAQSGIIVSNVPASDFAMWFKAHPPQIVLMHIGGADLLNSMPVAGVLKAYSLAVEQARLVNPEVRFLVAQHTPQEPDTCSNCRATVMELNADIVGWAMQISTPASPVSPVDLFTGIDVVADLSDRVHLNMSGSQKVADRWFAALSPLFKP